MKNRDLRIYLGLALFGVLLLGGIATAAFYQQEVSVFLQGGWNRGGIARAATDFIAHVQQKDYAGAAGLVDSARFKPIQEGSQVVGVQQTVGQYPDRRRFQDMYPSETAKVTSVEWSNADGGAFMVSLIFPSGRETRFLIRKIGGAFKIVQFLG